MNAEMKEAINAIAADKGMRPEVLYAVLADALESAYKKMPDAHEYAWVTIDPDTMEYRVIAQDLDDEGEPFGEEFEVTPDNFGRIAALAFKQVLAQGIREEEREQKYEEYAGRANTCLNAKAAILPKFSGVTSNSSPNGSPSSSRS